MELTPWRTLSTYVLASTSEAEGTFDSVRWWRKVAASKKGLDTTPKGTRQNRYTTKLCLERGLVMSLTQRKRVTSRSFSWRPICKNAFSTSLHTAIGNTRKRKSIPPSSGRRTGPRYRQSFRLHAFFDDLAEASYTRRSLVVVLSGFTTQWWGR